MRGFWERKACRQALQDAEDKGVVADSLTVRKELMERVHSGEITLEQAQKELARIKREAKRNGQVTRNQAYCGKLP